MSSTSRRSLPLRPPQRPRLFQLPATALFLWDGRSGFDPVPPLGVLPPGGAVSPGAFDPGIFGVLTVGASTRGDVRTCGRLGVSRQGVSGWGFGVGGDLGWGLLRLVELGGLPVPRRAWCWAWRCPAPRRLRTLRVVAWSGGSTSVVGVIGFPGPATTSVVASGDFRGRDFRGRDFRGRDFRSCYPAVRFRQFRACWFDFGSFKLAGSSSVVCELGVSSCSTRLWWCRARRWEPASSAAVSSVLGSCRCQRPRSVASGSGLFAPDSSSSGSSASGPSALASSLWLLLFWLVVSGDRRGGHGPCDNCSCRDRGASVRPRQCRCCRFLGCRFLGCRTVCCRTQPRLPVRDDFGGCRVLPGGVAGSVPSGLGLDSAVGGLCRRFRRCGRPPIWRWSPRALWAFSGAAVASRLAVARALGFFGRCGRPDSAVASGPVGWALRSPPILWPSGLRSSPPRRPAYQWQRPRGVAGGLGLGGGGRGDLGEVHRRRSQPSVRRSNHLRGGRLTGGGDGRQDLGSVSLGVAAAGVAASGASHRCHRVRVSSGAGRSLKSGRLSLPITTVAELMPTPPDGLRLAWRATSPRRSRRDLRCVTFFRNPAAYRAGAVGGDECAAAGTGWVRALRGVRTIGFGPD